jgi:hypothetical protein
LGKSLKFLGWRIVAAAVVTSRLAVGIPYDNVPFFYDYFQRANGWPRAQITGFPLAALRTIWLGPLLIYRFSPRKLILAGSALTAISIAGTGALEIAILPKHQPWP